MLWSTQRCISLCISASSAMIKIKALVFDFDDTMVPLNSHHEYHRRSEPIQDRRHVRIVKRIVCRMFAADAKVVLQTPPFDERYLAELDKPCCSRLDRLTSRSSKADRWVCVLLTNCPDPGIKTLANKRGMLLLSPPKLLGVPMIRWHKRFCIWRLCRKYDPYLHVNDCKDEFHGNFKFNLLRTEANFTLIRDL